MGLGHRQKGARRPRLGCGRGGGVCQRRRRRKAAAVGRPRQPGAGRVQQGVPLLAGVAGDARGQGREQVVAAAQLHVDEAPCPRRPLLEAHQAVVQVHQVGEADERPVRQADAQGRPPGVGGGSPRAGQEADQLTVDQGSHEPVDRPANDRHDGRHQHPGQQPDRTPEPEAPAQRRLVPGGDVEGASVGGDLQPAVDVGHPGRAQHQHGPVHLDHVLAVAPAAATHGLGGAHRGHRPHSPHLGAGR